MQEFGYNTESLQVSDLFAPNAKTMKMMKNRKEKMIQRTSKQIAFPARFPALFPASLPRRGSLTVEAAFALPLVLLFLTVFLRFSQVTIFQMRLQKALEEAVSQTAMTTGAAGVNTEIEAEWQVLLTREMALFFLKDASLVDGDKNGLDFSPSRLDQGTQRLELSVRYQISFPTGLLGTYRMEFSQTGARRLWTGSEGTSWKVEAPEEEEEQETVYITPSGTAYHFFRDCTYIKPTVRRVSIATVSSLRNQSGGSYYPCQHCQDTAVGAQVYITDYGDRYHYTLACGHITHDITAISLSEVGERHACSKCKAKKAKGAAH